jgi:hypothetical protein
MTKELENLKSTSKKKETNLLSSGRLSAEKELSSPPKKVVLTKKPKRPSLPPRNS